MDLGGVCFVVDCLFVVCVDYVCELSLFVCVVCGLCWLFCLCVVCGLYWLFFVWLILIVDCCCCLVVFILSLNHWYLLFVVCVWFLFVVDIGVYVCCWFVGFALQSGLDKCTYVKIHIFVNCGYACVCVVFLFVPPTQVVIVEFVCIQWTAHATMPNVAQQPTNINDSKTK